MLCVARLIFLPAICFLGRAQRFADARCCFEFVRREAMRRWPSLVPGRWLAIRRFVAAPPSLVTFRRAATVKPALAGDPLCCASCAPGLAAPTGPPTPPRCDVSATAFPRTSLFLAAPPSPVCVFPSSAHIAASPVHPTPPHRCLP